MKYCPLIICSIFLFLSNEKLQADENIDSSIALSEKLNKLEMFDLSLYLLQKTAEENPQSKDIINVQKAQTLFAMKNMKKGEEIINKISSSSPANSFSRFVLGTNAIERGKNDMGTKALEKYCAYMKNNMPPADSHLAKQFQKAVSYLIFAYKKEGKLKELAKATKYLDWPYKGEVVAEKSDDPRTKYEDTIRDSQTKLDAAEIMKKEGKSGWKDIVKKTVPLLKEVYWDGQTALAAMAAIELTKAYSMLGESEKALKELQQYWKLIKALDEGYRNAGIVPPSAKAYLWKGKSNLDLGEKAKDKDEKIKYLFTAAKNFLTIIVKYDQKKCMQLADAVAGFNKSKELLAKEGKNLKWPKGIKLPGGFDRKRADSMFEQDKYKEAIPLYMDILQKPGGRLSSDTPDILNRTAFAYLKTGKILESLTLAAYLGEYFPEDKDTASALLRVAETLWKQYKSSPASPKGTSALNDALMVYKIFLKCCPTHNFADEISARCAKVYYDRANTLAQAANSMPNGPEKLKKNKESRDAFKAAIPMYQHIVDNYLHTDLGKSSAYLLAWCYTNSKQYIKGSEIFAKFADAETNREDKNKRNLGQIADAKYRVAENYTRAAGDLEKEAKQLRIAAESAPTEDALKTFTPEKGTPLPLSEEALLKKSKEKTEQAIVYFKESVKNLNELLNKWMAPGGRLATPENPKDKTKIKDIKEKAISLLAWSYDGSRDNTNAITAFKNLIAKYPNKKEIPRAMLRLGMIYIEEDKANEASEILNELSSKYPEEGKKALPKLVKTMYQIKKYDKSIDAAEKIFEGAPEKIPVAEIKWIAQNLYNCDGTYPERGALVSLKACELLNKKIEDPDMPQWVGKDKAKSLEKIQKRKQKSSRF
jgi:tetratricopeptide (TPR) repeat protein